MDELAAAQVQAAVGGAFLVGFKEDQISGDEFLGAFGAQSQLVLLVGSAGDVDALLAEDVLEIAGAVKGFGSGAAELVWHSDIGFGCGYERFDLVLGQDGLAVGSQGAFGADSFAFVLGFLDVYPPGAGLGLFQSPPGGVVDDAGDADFLVPLELGHGPLGLCSVDAVQALDLVAYAV